MNQKGNIYKRLGYWVFVLAVVLRISLSIVNRESNDNHIQLIEFIEKESKLPTLADIAEEGFQPKLYHVAAACLFKSISPKHRSIRVILAQLLSCAAGILTLWIVYHFLRRTDLNEIVQFFSFSMVALNPKLIGINAQATNDSFVILFATGAIYCTYRFLADCRPRWFIPLLAFSVLAGLSKGNGLVVFACTCGVFGLRLLGPWNPSKRFYKTSIGYASLYCLIYLAIVPFAGQYYFNHTAFGSPFAINQKKDPFPNFVERTYVKRPGITSIVDGYLTFRILDMLRNPVITNDKDVYPKHRTSFWSQLYGRTHFLYFDYWPPSWQTQNGLILTLGRITLLLGVIPTAVFLLGLFRRIKRWAAALWKRKMADILSDWEWPFDVFLLGYLSFIILYTLWYRDYACMKVIFVFPALLPVVSILTSETGHLLGLGNPVDKLLKISLWSLFACYTLQVVLLIFKLAK